MISANKASTMTMMCMQAGAASYETLSLRAL